jgi:hypothetical protein
MSIYVLVGLGCGLIGYTIGSLRLVGHVHDWGSWGDPEKRSSESQYYPAYNVQARICRSCNLCEERRV